MQVRQRPFSQVDVFTATPYLGNPVAVVLDGAGLSTQEMLAFTSWTNLSECTFVQPAQDAHADYKVRIFCPGRELPFAGHPTLGTAHAWLRAGGKPRGQMIVQECAIGLVQIRQNDANHTLAFAAPPLINNAPLPEQDLALLLKGLALRPEDVIEHRWCDNGPQWRGLLLNLSREQLLAIRPDPQLLDGLFVGLVAKGKPGEETPFEVRAFFPGNQGLIEDPVTGSLNAALAQWLIGSRLAPPRYTAAQGTALGRAGRVMIEQVGSEIWVGGQSVSCIEGRVLI